MEFRQLLLCCPKWPPKNCPKGVWSKYEKWNSLNEVGLVIHQNLHFEERNSFLVYLAQFRFIEAQKQLISIWPWTASYDWLWSTAWLRALFTFWCTLCLSIKTCSRDPRPHFCIGWTSWNVVITLQWPIQDGRRRWRGLRIGQLRLEECTCSKKAETLDSLQLVQELPLDGYTFLV